MIDDSQVQTISCNWVESYSNEIERIVLNIKYSPNEFLPKEGLIFVRVVQGSATRFTIPGGLQAA